MRDLNEFNLEYQEALKRIWFLGDVHGHFTHIAEALLDSEEEPSWLVFLGDIDVDHTPFRKILEPLRRNFPVVKVAFIHGNHDADTYQHWDMLHDCGDAIALHGKVVDLDGVRVAGLGGNFLGRVWYPPGEKKLMNKRVAMDRGPFQWRGGQRPNPSFRAAIYPDDVESLSQLRADILVTHEAPSCHPHGFAVIDELARSLRVTRTFHGHQHDDRTAEYEKLRDSLGFDAIAVDYCGIKNGLGEVIFKGPQGW
jgi:predicted phosphodiesterase